MWILAATRSSPSSKCRPIDARWNEAGRRRYAARKFLSAPKTGNLHKGFFQTDTYGNRGTNYGWGMGTCVLRTPHEGMAEMLSPGSCGHGGAWGTQAWIYPV